MQVPVLTSCSLPDYFLHYTTVIFYYQSLCSLLYFLVKTLSANSFLWMSAADLFFSCSHFGQNSWTSTDASSDTNQVFVTVDSKRIGRLNVSATLNKTSSLYISFIVPVSAGSLLVICLMLLKMSTIYCKVIVFCFFSPQNPVLSLLGLKMSCLTFHPLKKLVIFM